MTQNGQVRKTLNRAFENYESLHKYLRHMHGDKVNEWSHQHKQLSTAAAVDVSNKGTTPITITQIALTETNLQVKSSAADAGLEHAVITAHYLDNTGTAHTATIADATADMSAATDFDTPVTDFFCWDIEGYGVNCFTSSLAVGGGLTLDAGVTGTGNAQIAATKLVGTKLSYIGVGTIYGQEVGAANTSAGFVITLDFITPWGQPLTGTETVNANADLQGQFILDSNGFPVQSYFRTRRLYSDTVMADEFEITNYEVDAFYGVIDIGNYESIHTRFMALGADYGKSYFGEIIATFPSIVDTLTVIVTYTPYGESYARTVSWDVFVNHVLGEALHPIQLEPCSELSITINDGNTAHANANISLRCIEVEA